MKNILSNRVCQKYKRQLAQLAQSVQQLQQLKQQVQTLEKLVKLQDEQLTEFEKREQNYRAIISETLEMLHASDKHARVSLTASELMTIIHGYESDDLPFE